MLPWHGTLLAPAREIHRRDHTSEKEKQITPKQTTPKRQNILARCAKVQIGLKHRFITLAWPEAQKSAMLLAWGPHSVAETLERRARGRRM